MKIVKSVVAIWSCLCAALLDTSQPRRLGGTTTDAAETCDPVSVVHAPTDRWLPVRGSAEKAVGPAKNLPAKQRWVRLWALDAVARWAQGQFQSAWPDSPVGLEPCPRLLVLTR